MYIYIYLYIYIYTHRETATERDGACGFRDILTARIVKRVFCFAVLLPGLCVSLSRLASLGPRDNHTQRDNGPSPTRPRPNLIPPGSPPQPISTQRPRRQDGPAAPAGKNNLYRTDAYTTGICIRISIYREKRQQKQTSFTRPHFRVLF